MDLASPSSPPLRVGLLLNSFLQPAWVLKVVEDIQSSKFAEVSLIIKNESASEPQSRVKSYWQNRKYLLYALYNRIDSNVKIKNDAFAMRDIREVVSTCAVLGVQPIQKKHSDWFSDEDLRKIKDQKIDVALSFGFRILRGEILRIFKHGVWSYHHGDNLVNRGGPAGFWEVMDGVPVTGAILQVLTEDLDNGTVICRTRVSTADKFSVRANKNHVYWQASGFVIRTLKQLHEEGSVTTSENGYRPYSNKLYRMPTNSELFPKLSKLAWLYTKTKLQQVLFTDRWALAYRFRSSPDDQNNTFYRFKYLVPPAGLFWADPFPLKVNDKYYLFFEEFVYETKKGRIAVAELGKSGFSDRQVALELDYHLSYPFVFRWQDRLMMIPETAGNKRIELYACKTFPHEWELEAILMEDVSAKDATLIEIEGVWWMFVAISEPPFVDQLHIFYADSPLGAWRPHKLNPLKHDVRNSRPAGKMFRWNGELYRPAQDGSRRYGYGITLNKVVRLTPEEFSEEEVSKVLPNWGKEVLATHTLNTCDDLTVIDCVLRTRR